MKQSFSFLIYKTFCNKESGTKLSPLLCKEDNIAPKCDSVQYMRARYRTRSNSPDKLKKPELLSSCAGLITAFTLFAAAQPNNSDRGTQNVLKSIVMCAKTHAC